MNIPYLPTPEGLAQLLLVKKFGPDSIIVLLFVLVVVARAWKQSLDDAAYVGRKTIAAAIQVTTLKPIAIVVALIGTGVTFVTQFVWLWSCYVVGNAWAYAIHPPRPLPESGPEWGLIFRTLHWDTVSKSYFIISVVALAVSYVGAARGDDSSSFALLFVAPTGLIAVGIGLMCLLIVSFEVLRRLVDGYWQFTPYEKGMLILLGFLVASIVSSLIALSTPELLADLWKKKP